jgi:hypothetical protein
VTLEGALRAAAVVGESAVNNAGTAIVLCAGGPIGGLASAEQVSKWFLRPSPFAGQSGSATTAMLTQESPADRAEALKFSAPLLLRRPMCIRQRRAAIGADVADLNRPLVHRNPDFGSCEYRCSAADCIKLARRQFTHGAIGIWHCKSPVQADGGPSVPSVCIGAGEKADC